jgi:hypothetical protein
MPDCPTAAFTLYYCMRASAIPALVMHTASTRMTSPGGDMGMAFAVRKLRSASPVPSFLDKRPPLRQYDAIAYEAADVTGI